MQVQVLSPAFSPMSKAPYKSIAVIEAQGFDDEVSVCHNVESSLEPDESLLPLSLAAMLHGGFRRIDHLLGDGQWVHGAVGA